MVISRKTPKEKVNIGYGEPILKRTNSTEYLGFHFDEDLKWDLQATYILNKTKSKWPNLKMKINRLNKSEKNVGH